jgi:tripartite-type tricarboxylate transporter receptor subunit TctC
MKGAWSTLAQSWIAAGIAGAAVLAPLAAAHGEEFPSHTVRLIVNVAAGGLTDTLARLAAQGLGEKWSQPVIVENIVGANSTLAASAVMRAKPDGHTLLATADAPFTSTPHLFKNLNYSLANFAPIGIICRAVPVLAVRSSLGVKTLPEFVALAKAKPGALSYGSMGVGTFGHLGMEDLKNRTGIDMLHVPYRGGAPAIEGLLRGDVAALIINSSNIAPYEHTGQVTVIAALSNHRSEFRPNLPTAIEQGVPGYSVSTWFGIFGPAALPAATLAKIRKGLDAALLSKKAVDYFKNNSCERVEDSPAEFNNLIAADYKHWGDIIQSIGLRTQ